MSDAQRAQRPLLPAQTTHELRRFLASRDLQKAQEDTLRALGRYATSVEQRSRMVALGLQLVEVCREVLRAEAMGNPEGVALSEQHARVLEREIGEVLEEMRRVDR